MLAVDLFQNKIGPGNHLNVFDFTIPIQIAKERYKEVPFLQCADRGVRSQVLAPLFADDRLVTFDRFYCDNSGKQVAENLKTGLCQKRSCIGRLFDQWP